MDNFKTLFERGEYELVIKATKNSNDVDDLFYCLSAYLATNQVKEALELINNKFVILKTQLPMLMRTHIEILCLINQFDEAYEKIAYYKELPYYSQEAEEVLKELPKIVREYEKHYYQGDKKKDDEDTIIKHLLSDDSLTVLGAIDQLRDKNIEPYLLYLRKIMSEFPKQSVRSFALLFLVQRSIDQEFKFLHVDKMINVNPSKLHPPFVGEEFTSIKMRMQEEYRDTSLTDTAIELLSTYLIYIYPEEVDLSDHNLLVAFKIIASRYLSIPVEIEESDEIHHLVDDINQALTNF